MSELSDLIYGGAGDHDFPKLGAEGGAEAAPPFPELFRWLPPAEDDNAPGFPEIPPPDRGGSFPELAGETGAPENAAAFPDVARSDLPEDAPPFPEAGGDEPGGDTPAFPRTPAGPPGSAALFPEPADFASRDAPEMNFPDAGGDPKSGEGGLAFPGLGGDSVEGEAVLAFPDAGGQSEPGGLQELLGTVQGMGRSLETLVGLLQGAQQYAGMGRSSGGTRQLERQQPAFVWQAPAEGYPAASPSANVSSRGGLRGAGGYGFGSKGDADPTDFYEPGKHAP